MNLELVTKQYIELGHVNYQKKGSYFSDIIYKKPNILIPLFF